MALYETRRDAITAVALKHWAQWIRNDPHFDREPREQTLKSVQDAIANTYIDDISDADWLTAALGRLMATR
jgi:hypothetical protein